LSGCGLSEGDEVIVLPDDKLTRSDSMEGKIAKINDKTILVSNKLGTLLEFPSSEVFAIDDDEAQAVSIARSEFYRVLEKNIKAYHGELSLTKEEGGFSVGEVLLDKAEEAQLDEWIAYFKTNEALAILLRKYVNKDDISRHELAEEMVDFIDDGQFDDLEEAVQKLSDTNARNGFGFAMLAPFRQVAKYSIDLVKSPTGKARNLIPGIKNTDDVKLTTGAFTAKENIKAAIKNADIYVELLVKAAQHKKLINGEKFTDAELEKLRAHTKNSLVDAAFPAALRFAREEMKSTVPSIELAERVLDIGGFEKQDLVRIHKKETWAELESEILAAQVWQERYVDSSWKGMFKVTLHRVLVDLDAELALIMSDTSLYDVAATLRAKSYRGDIDLEGTVVYDSEKVIIKDSLGNWSWFVSINDKGQLVAKGQLPFKRYLHNVAVTFSSPAMLERKERNRQTRILKFTDELKKEPWYGVVFKDSKPTGLLIKLDFNKGIFEHIDISSKNITSDSSQFTHFVDENGRGEIKENKEGSISLWVAGGKRGKKTTWNSGDKWNFALDKSGKILNAGFVTKKMISSNKYYIDYMRESEYKRRLVELAGTQPFRLKAGDITYSSKGGKPKKWNELIDLNIAKIQGDRVILEGSYSRDKGMAVKIDSVVVPYVDGGAVIYMALPENKDALFMKNGLDKLDALGTKRRAYQRLGAKKKAAPPVVNLSKNDDIEVEKEKEFSQQPKLEVEKQQSTEVAPPEVLRPKNTKEDRRGLYELALSYVQRARLSRRSNGQSAVDILTRLEGANVSSDEYAENLKEAIVNKYLDLAEKRIGQRDLVKAKLFINKAQNIMYSERAVSLKKKIQSTAVVTMDKESSGDENVNAAVENINNATKESVKAVGDFMRGLLN